MKMKKVLNNFCLTSLFRRHSPDSFFDPNLPENFSRFDFCHTQTSSSKKMFCENPVNLTVLQKIKGISNGRKLEMGPLNISKKFALPKKRKVKKHRELSLKVSSQIAKKSPERLSWEASALL